LTESIAERIDRILKFLGQLEPGDWILVRWHDAADFRRVRHYDDDYVLTRKESKGVFAELRNMHLILEQGSTNGGEKEGEFIPVEIIDDLEKVASGPRKASKKTIRPNHRKMSVLTIKDGAQPQ